jgi:uncharacterized protein
LGRALAKRELRVLAVDDGPFERGQRWAPVVMVAMTLPETIDGIATGRVRVDGTDATDTVLALIRASPHREGARAILVDGISVGGFNVLDLDRIARESGRPVVSATRRPPDLARMRAALFRYFPKDARRRWALIRAHPVFAQPTGGEPIWIGTVGSGRAEARALVARATRHGYWPEPLRVAHLVARAVAGWPSGTEEGAPVRASRAAKPALRRARRRRTAAAARPRAGHRLARGRR